MALSTGKLSKSEWERTENPVSTKELKVLRFLCAAAHDPSLKSNECPTLYQYLKVESSPKMDRILAEYLEKGVIPSNADSATRIRLERSSKVIPADIYEKRLMAAMASKSPVHAYFMTYYLSRLSVARPNPLLQQRALDYLSSREPDLKATVLHSPELFQFCDVPDLKLYEYQREMFELEPGLVILTAPTGTGKTLLPIGLAEKGHRILYVCDRPTALDFAQKCISVGRKVAFAFGCEGPEDVRLHRSAATVFKKNKHTGGVGKIDNLVGDLVEVVIADVASAEHAMRWWAFQKQGYDLLYWDEPDKDKHTNLDTSLWPAARQAWRANTASFVVMSSATLPVTMPEVEADYTARFPGKPVHHIGRNTVYNGTQVKLLNSENEVVMPHHVYEDCSETIRANPSLLRYVDLAQAVEVLRTTEGWEGMLRTMEEVSNPICIKMAYVSVMHLASPTKYRLYDSVIRATREDAWTITGGAAIYMAKDVEKVGQVMLKASGIPAGVLARLNKNIEINTANALKMEELRKEFENATAVDAEKTNKMADERYSNPVAKKLQEEMKLLVRMPVKLEERYVPNMPAHCALWKPKGAEIPPFVPDVDDTTAEKIVDTKVAEHWKVLLLMGVAVLTETDVAYLEIVKQMASLGMLFMVIADFTYLTGTNYQFAHGYFGKDLADLNQGMVVQALGRIGRGDLLGCTARVREPGMFEKLFGPEDARNGQLLAQVFSSGA
jgi:hypothetical protein